MKNTTRRPPLIIHSAPKQSQRGHLETKVESDSPFTASQHPTLLQLKPASTVMRWHKKAVKINTIHGNSHYTERMKEVHHLAEGHFTGIQ